MRRAAVGLAELLAVTALGVALLSTGGCHPPSPAPRGPAAAASPLAACPRDARPDASGRCVCDPGDVPVLGACVPPPVADAYCGPASRATASGACVFPTCAADEAVDVGAGCVPLGTLLHGGPRSCGEAATLAIEGRRSVCIPADAACPRGTHAAGAACVHLPQCPPGTLTETGGTCRPVVLRGAGGSRLVDLGAWAALVLGADGGPASADLCRPLQARPATLEVGPADRLPLRLGIALSAPGNDVTRVSADVNVTSPGAAHPPPPAAAALAEAAVAALLEPLRGLGGETTSTRVDVEVRCVLGLAAGK
ncbi:MAG TPA: hypothetical protein VIJ22_13345 [Polyangiaceae bacterium]